MNDDRKRILDMVAQGKISVQEAGKLIDALSQNQQAEPSAQDASSAMKKELKYLRVVVDSKQGDNVNIRVPMALLRAGLKLSALVPPLAYQKINEKLSENGVDIDINMLLKSSDIEQIIESLGELNVDVNSAQGDKVRVFFE